MIYELKEKIFHNQYRLHIQAQPPSYFGDNYGAHFPIFEVHTSNISVKDIYSEKTLDFYFKHNEWKHVTRSAYIKSKPANISQLQMDTNFRLCSVNSKRNYGRRGSFIYTVIKYGSFYHRLIPESIEKWSKEKLNFLLSAKAYRIKEGMLLLVCLFIASF